MGDKIDKEIYMYLSTADSSFTATTISSLGVKECVKAMGLH
jgi:hypothetical protein